MTIYYVDFTNGLDTNDGLTVAAPFKHPPFSNLAGSEPVAAQSIIGSGDIVKFKAGERWENTIITIPNKDGGAENVLFTSYGEGANPLVSARTYIRSGWIAAGSEYYAEGISAKPVNVFAGEVKLEEGSGIGSLTDGQWYYDIGNTDLYVKLATLPEVSEISYPTQDRPVYYSGTTKNYQLSKIDLDAGISTSSDACWFFGSTDMSLSDLSIYKERANAVRAYNTLGKILLNNLTSDTGLGSTVYMSGTAESIELSNSSFASTVNVNCSGEVSIHDCELESPESTIGIQLQGTAVSEFYANHIFSLSTIYSAESSGTGTVTIRDNVFDNINAVGAIHLVSGTNYVKNNVIDGVWNGLLYGAGGYGLGMEIEGGDNTVIGNTISRCYWGVTSTTTDDIRFYHNLFKNNLVNNLETASVSPNSASVFNNTFHHRNDPSVITENGHALMFRTSASTKKGSVKNNIIYLDPLQAGTDGLQIDEATFEIDLSNNIYFKDTSIADGNLLYRAGVNYDDDFAAWVTATGDTDSIIADPLFVDVENEDYHILPTSPAVGAGLDVGLKEDIEGNQLYAPFNIGAFGGLAENMRKATLTYAGKAKYNLLIIDDTFAFPLCKALWTIDQAAGGDFFYDSADSNAPIYRTEAQWIALPFVNKSDDGRVGIGPRAKYVYSVVQDSVAYARAQRIIGN